MEGLKTVGLVALAVYGLVFIVLLCRTHRPGKVLLWYVLSAAWAFAMVRLLGPIWSFHLPVSPLNVTATALFGIPGLAFLIFFGQYGG